MGGKGSGRLTKTEEILRDTSIQHQSPIATEMFIPNHSGDHSKGAVYGTPTKDYDIVNKAYVDANAGGVPAGCIISWLGNLSAQGVVVPTGWLQCNGQSISKTTYPDLFDVIGYTYGGADDDFNVPNLTLTFLKGIDIFDPGGVGTFGGSLVHTHDIGVAGVFSTSSDSAGTPSGTVGNENAHTHAVTSPTGNEAAHTHGVGTYAANAHTSVSRTTSGSGTTLLTGPASHTMSGTSGAGSSHSHTVTSPTGAGSIHTHTFTGNAMAGHQHAISGATDDGNGEPVHMLVVWIIKY